PLLSLSLTLPAPTTTHTLSLHDALPIYIASGEDPAHRVRPLGCGATCRVRARQTGNVRLPWLYTHLRTDPARPVPNPPQKSAGPDRKSTRLNSSHLVISYAVFCLKKKKK